MVEKTTATELLIVGIDYIRTWIDQADKVIARQHQDVEGLKINDKRMEQEAVNLRVLINHQRNEIAGLNSRLKKIEKGQR